MVGTIFRGALVIACLAGPALAEPIESRRLLTQGDWVVEHSFDAADGGMWCSAETESAAGQLFSLTAFDYGGLSLIVYDPSWTHAAAPMRFSLGVDGDSWRVGGMGQGRAVIAELTDREVAASFLAGLVRGASVRVAAEPGGDLATFALDGSLAAIDSLMECWGLIRPAGGTAEPTRAPGDRA